MMARLDGRVVPFSGLGRGKKVCAVRVGWQGGGQAAK